MNVLSLFDGMSCGQIALERVGIKVDNYYASEIDRYAIEIARKNYPNTKHIGNIVNVRGSDLPKIDLLIGGSPCQGFSTAGKELNFEDTRSKLFFEFVRLLKEINPKYFMLENVSMKLEYRNIISKYLDAEPILINSSLVSGQNRKRYYWTNIPNIQQPKDKGLSVSDVIGIKSVKVGQMQPFPRNYKKLGLKRTARLELRKDNKSNTLMVNASDNLVQQLDVGGFPLVRKLNVNECELLQTIPLDYTKGTSNTQRYKMIGNGWTVDVIAHIFKNLK